MKMLKSFKVLALSFCLLLAFANLSFAADKTANFGIGDEVTDFTVTNYDGSTYTLSEAPGDVTVIMFWSTQCPFVQPYTDRINTLANELMSQGVTFWAVNSNVTEDVDAVKNHAAAKGYPFPMLKDENSAIADLLGAERTPEVFVIDNSNMTLIYHGSIDDNKDADAVTSENLKNALTEFLNGQAISNAESKSFGCTIKRN